MKERGWSLCKKKIARPRVGARLNFGREKKLGLGFFVVALNFSLKIVLCKFYPPPPYDWRFTYI
jgi:hypothetical protein